MVSRDEKFGRKASERNQRHSFSSNLSFTWNFAIFSYRYKAQYIYGVPASLLLPRRTAQTMNSWLCACAVLLFIAFQIPEAECEQEAMSFVQSMDVSDTLPLDSETRIGK